MGFGSKQIKKKWVSVYRVKRFFRVHNINRESEMKGRLTLFLNRGMNAFLDIKFSCGLKDAVKLKFSLFFDANWNSIFNNIFSNYSCWYTTSQNKWRDVFCYNRASSNNATFTNFYTR